MRRYSPEDYRDNEELQASRQRYVQPYQTPPAVSSLSDFTVTVNTGSQGGATAQFTLVNSIQGISAIKLLRNSESTIGTAQVIDTWNISTSDIGRTFKHTDVDPAITKSISYYWLQIIPTSTTATSPISASSTLYVVGPQTLNQLNGNQLPPGQISDFSVSLSAGFSLNGTNHQTVYVNWKQQPSDPNLAGVVIKVAGYNGDPNEVALVSHGSSPFSFNMIQTGQTLTLKAEAYSINGKLNTASPATASITLNGGETVPAANFTVTAIKARTGIQVDFDAGIEPDISVYTVYRSAPGAGFGSASSIGTVTPSAGTYHYSYLDSTAINQEFDYYVKATNPVGQSAVSNTASSKAVIDNRGGVPPAVTGGFTYSATTTSITWTSTGTQILRSDDTVTNVPDGNTTISGLSSSTIYYFYPRWNDATSTLEWVSGGHGTPGYAFLAAERSNTLAQQQNLNQCIPLSSAPMQASTTSTGTGGGSGGGSGECLRHTMVVEEKTKGVIAAHQVQPGDWLKCMDGWVKVLSVKIVPFDIFVRIGVNGRFLEVTPTHPFMALDACCNPLPKVEAGDLTLRNFLYTIDGIGQVEGMKAVHVPDGQKVLIECEEPHTFFAGEEEPYILAHNLMMVC